MKSNIPKDKLNIINEFIDSLINQLSYGAITAKELPHLIKDEALNIFHEEIKNGLIEKGEMQF
ncbi:MAG: hypothetical protein H8E60_08685 [Candidatus Marinimicrobia bacterium]|nr:hypothetical protein [Candidatus Neomarinimicrobiota bacterium]